MHVRWSSCVGLAVMVAGSPEPVARLSEPLINPDSGVIEGFFVEIPSFLSSKTLFLSRFDVLRWGAAVLIRDFDSLAPADDRIRLQPLLEDPRTFLGQKVETEGGDRIGIAKDIQFDTEAFQIEWVFPRKWWTWKQAVARTEILRVTDQAICIKNPKKPIVVEDTSSPLEDLADVAISRPGT